jgi:hypothetical protein
MQVRTTKLKHIEKYAFWLSAIPLAALPAQVQWV